MMIARWHIEARFGHKQAVIDAVRRWCDDIGTAIDWTPDKVRIAAGSVGAPEAVVELEVRIDDLADLNESWTKLASIDAHAAFSKELEPNVVSGSTRWEVFRIV